MGSYGEYNPKGAGAPREESITAEYGHMLDSFEEVPRQPRYLESYEAGETLQLAMAYAEKHKAEEGNEYARNMLHQ